MNEEHVDHHWQQKLLLVVTSIVFVFTVGVGWFALDAVKERCEFSADARDDARAMWEYLLEQRADNPEAPAFRAELDRRLPALECGGPLEFKLEEVKE